MKDEPHENSASAGTKEAEGGNEKTGLREEAKKIHSDTGQPDSSGQNEKAGQQGHPGQHGLFGQQGQTGQPANAKDKKPTVEKPTKEDRPKRADDSGNFEKLAAEYKETLQRLQAEFENFRKRSERENEAFRKIAAAKTIAEFLPVLDSVEDGIRHANALKDREMETGLMKVKGQFMQVLERNDIKQIDAKGKKFSHELHEALMAVEDRKAEDGIVLEELQKGYSMNGLVLRPAKVKVNRKETKEENLKENENVNSKGVTEG